MTDELELQEPEPTEEQLIREAEDCEHVPVISEVENPFGYVTTNVYRSASLGRQVVVTYRWVEVIREGEVCGWVADEEFKEVRDYEA
jgi:hypothetical protein